MSVRSSYFGGVAGGALRDALRRSTWMSGMVLVSALFLAARGLDALDQARWFPLTALVVLASGMAYHGVRATVPHDPTWGAGISRMCVVAVRVILASALWFAPWMFWSASQAFTAPILEMIGFGSSPAAAVFLLGCLLGTPLFLIAALNSTGWFDVVSPIHWGHQFSRRGTDLLTIYTIQTGGVALAAAVSIGATLVAFRFNSTAALAVTGLSSCAVLGFWTSLGGRLCGSIRAVEAVEEARAAMPRFDEGLAIAGPALDTELNRDLPERPEYRETEPDPVDDPVDEPAEPVVATAKPEADAVEEPSTEELPPSVETAQQDLTPEAARLRRYTAPATPVAFDAPRPSTRARKTPLLDAEARVEESLRRFRLDPSHTLSQLARLSQDFAPNAHVLQAFTICLHRTGHTDQAFKAARQAFPLCFERGLVTQAAAMFYELRGQLHRLDLEQDQVMEIARVLHDADELASAAKAYSLVVHADPEEFLAIKGLLDVADRIAAEKNKPQAALKVYMFLLEHCAEPSLTGLIRAGIEQCHAAEVNAADLEASEVPVGS